MISSKALYSYFEGNGSLHPAIICDLFGALNWTKQMKENRNDTLGMFLGLYKGLYIMDVPYKEIYRCFLKNKLDELIHIKYSINKSDYYREFYEKQIKIGNTFMVDEDEEDEEDKNEKHEPFIYSTIQPPFHYNQSKSKIVDNSLGKEDEIILHKINSYKSQDEKKRRDITNEYVTINDVKKLLYKLENKCYVCGDNVITDAWQPKCLYQFTLDRIDNSLPHNRNNVLICCYYCNCRDYNNDQDKTDTWLYKLCPNKCHIIKRNITRTRDSVSYEETKKMMIK